ncbi:MAG: phage tail protein [Alphaproteobacteria bacterium]|nr:phage tail protein [Alphaproteobacteria bacterium]
MADPFVAEIRIFGFNFAPKGWAFCDGQILPISQNTALFSLLGTTYGGDGKSTFALPNLQGNVPLHAGQGPGLSQYFIGEESGTETVTLLISEMPAHSHAMGAQSGPAGTNTPTPDGSATLARAAGGSSYKVAPFGSITQLAPQAMTPTGGGLPHNNMMPYITMNFCIALQGVFPPRT